MALSVTHQFVSAIPDGGNASLVQPSNWNATHSISGSLSGASIDLTVGSTTIGSGTSTRILYDNAGVVGEYTLTGSGTVVAMQTAPSFLTSITTPSVLATANDSGALGASGTAFADLFLASGGVINWNAGDVTLTHASGALQLSSGSSFGWSTDLFLQRDAANTLALRNGVNTQTFNLYNTYANGGTDYERVTITYDSGIAAFMFRGQMGGTGSHRSVGVEGGGNVFGFGMTANGNVNWTLVAGHMLTGTDNSYDIGASGASRPRTIYAATSVITTALRIDQAPSAVGTGTKTISNAADSSTNFGHYFSVNLNGTTYFIPCSATAPT